MKMLIASRFGTKQAYTKGHLVFQLRVERISQDELIGRVLWMFLQELFFKSYSNVF